MLSLWALGSNWAAPFVDNNAGLWRDEYGDALGLFSTTQTQQDPFAGIVQLTPGMVSGSYVTTDVVPSSFDGWNQIALEGTFSSFSDVTVDILDTSGMAVPGLPI